MLEQNFVFWNDRFYKGHVHKRDLTVALQDTQGRAFLLLSPLIRITEEQSTETCPRESSMSNSPSARELPSTGTQELSLSCYKV